ncbi:sensor histidine kinase [Runella sp.]|uniref:sensor histidine kinase n=1 Tax=Runella sp. TaxID=1960881 RepID=UPI003D09F702
MKIPAYTKQNTVIQLAVLPVYIPLVNWILIGNLYWSDWRIFLVTSLLMFGFIYPHWFINNIIALEYHRLYQHPNQLVKRLIYTVILSCFNSCLFTWIAYQSFGLAGFSEYHPQPVRLAWGLSFVIFTVIVVTAVFESINAFEQWEKTLRETEQLKKIHLQTQFEGLKSQINPHFLFNSLNSLSSLIEEDTDQAERFVEEMSSVYRYLLRSNETQLVRLSDELTFANSYFHLLSTRYGENIRLEQAIDDDYQEYLLPPLTLQLLLENAIKHNVILPEQPLHIHIETISAGHPSEQTGEPGRLRIRNNLQRKSTKVLSNRVGLANITTQYRLLGGGEVVVQDDDAFFTVTLPLIRRN